MKKISSADLKNLEVYLHYFHVSELKETCVRLQLSSSGKKCDLIQFILVYLKTGKKQSPTSIPEVSKAKKGTEYPLNPRTQILMGSYKNDLATRNFFKKLIGHYFHFTAFGIDWINKRWREGNPPTYGEFASFWKKEYELRKQKKVLPKKEWAYLNFIQRCLLEHPNFSKEQIGKAWKKERNLYVQKGKDILEAALD